MGLSMPKSYKKKDDRDSFGLACHNFLDIQSSSRKQLTPSSKVHATDSLIQNMLNRFRHLEMLSLIRCRGISDSGLAPLQMYGFKLQYLNLSFCSRVTDNGLSYVASGCPLLSIVGLYKCCFITDYGLQILTESCKSLKHVDLSLCCEITDNGIQCLNQNCRQLTKLGISGCDKILGKGFQGVSPTLACFEAKNCPFDSKGVSAVLSGGGLEYLNLSRDKYPWECDLAAIGLGFGAHIKTLDLKNCNFVEDATIMKIAQGCPLLQEWNLSGCDKITDHGWRSIGLYCQNLEILHANRCKNLGKRRLKVLVVEGFPRLSVIYMTRCPLNLNNYYFNEEEKNAPSYRKYISRHPRNKVEIREEELKKEKRGLWPSSFMKAPKAAVKNNTDYACNHPYSNQLVLSIARGVLIFSSLSSCDCTFR
ncbi:leucine-rich repeat domain, L domain-like protein [Artemisia annua]|uniref:Leucine-rich repeat domain, L domain-like protein n=1 Tax=Artemisia annua TaxID=35608 RepID=A0A2U1MVJ0_ARTAN|nr:leucine-rich repeat domain, L domain-like protein [Artemisia annua]